MVPARAADEAIVAQAAREGVEVRAALHDVVAASAEKPVHSGTAGQHVVAQTAVEVAPHVRREAPEDVVARTAHAAGDGQQVGTGAAIALHANQDVVAVVAFHAPAEAHAQNVGALAAVNLT